MKAEDLNKDIKICPCCKDTFDNSKVTINNEVDNELLCEGCIVELNSYNYDWQRDC